MVANEREGKGGFIFYFITLSCAIVLLVVSKDEVLSCAHTSISLVERH